MSIEDIGKDMRNLVQPESLQESETLEAPQKKSKPSPTPVLVSKSKGCVKRLPPHKRSARS